MKTQETQWDQKRLRFSHFYTGNYSKTCFIVTTAVFMLNSDLFILLNDNMKTRINCSSTK